MDRWIPEKFFSADSRERLERLVDLNPVFLGQDEISDAELARVEVIVGGWGMTELTATWLDRMPNLRAVFYTAGSVKEFATDEVFRRGIAVTSGADTNAVPVAEFTLGAILLSGKRIFQIADGYVKTRDYRPVDENAQWGNFGLKVGIVGASRIGRRVIDLLRPFDLDIAVYDPTLSDALPGTRLAPELDELLAASDVVSLHAPSIPATQRMLNERTLALMPDGATLINTARGALVDHDALVTELTSGRLHAVIDVTEPDPLPADSPLFGAPNLIMTPHIAGSQGNEFYRLGDAALDEIERFNAGRPLQTRVDHESLSFIA